MTDPEQASEQASELHRLADARAALAALRPRIAGDEPWPLAEAFGTEPEASWGPREVLAHLAEMLSFWLGELERVVDGEGSSPVPFGRVADDASRIGLIGRDRSLPLRVLFDRVDAGISGWMVRLPTLTEADRERVGLHPRLGDMAVGRMCGRFIVGHTGEHIAQLESILAAAGR